MVEVQQALTVQELISDLTSRLGRLDKPNQLSALIMWTLRAPDEVFWPVMTHMWSGLEFQGSSKSQLLHVFRRRAVTASGVMYLGSEDRVFFDGLPEPVPIFRGCAPWCVRSLSWTAERNTAEWFARRTVSFVGDAVLATALIPKSAIFFAVTDRGEHEVVIDPRGLRKLKTEDVRCFLNGIQHGGRATASAR